MKAYTLRSDTASTYFREFSHVRQDRVLYFRRTPVFCVLLLPPRTQTFHRHCHSKLGIVHKWGGRIYPKKYPPLPHVRHCQNWEDHFRALFVWLRLFGCYCTFEIWNGQFLKQSTALVFTNLADYLAKNEI